MEITNKEEIIEFGKTQQEISGDEIHVLYEYDRYDRPLEGVCTWKDKEFYFIWTGEMDESEDEIVRSYVLVKLTDQQLAADKKQYELFLEAKEKGELEEFYEQKKSSTSVTISPESIVGRFKF